MKYKEIHMPVNSNNTMKFDQIYVDLLEYIRLYDPRKSKTDQTFKSMLASALEQGFPIDYIPKTRRDTLLNYAIDYHKDDLALILLEAGADVNIITPDQRNCLSSTIANISLPVMREVAARTENINLKNSYDYTAFQSLCIHYIFAKEDESQTLFPKLKLLLEFGAELEIPFLFSASKEDKNRAVKLKNFLTMYTEQRSAVNHEQRSAVNHKDCVKYEYEL